jgi:hypothetical protein
MRISLFSFKQTTITRPNRFPLPVVLGQDPRTGLSSFVAHPPGQGRQLLGIPLKRLNRLVAFNPQPVLQPAQELVATLEHLALFTREHLAGSQGVQGRKSIPMPHCRKAVTIAQLQHLHKKLNIDQTTPAGFDIKPLIRLCG